MSQGFQGAIISPCPSPHGEGGLKYCVHRIAGLFQASLPPRGGWIEILSFVIYPLLCRVPPPTGRVD